MLRLLGLSIFVLNYIFISAQETDLYKRFDLDSKVNYLERIPSPENFLGYELGDRFTEYARVIHYLQLLSESSDRIEMRQYGTTYEGRKLYSLVISSSENMRNIDQIRRTNLDFMAAAGRSDPFDTKKAMDMPVFVSFSYNIHGNEASSTEAVMRVSYRLVAANDQETNALLSDAIVILFPCINPDGRDRYVYWYNGAQRAVPAISPFDFEHYAPWPNGRTNHYWFDLNRDWIWGVHPESRGQTKEYQHWMPHLHTDYHEMGYNSNYFTMPGTTPRNKLLPDHYESLSDTIGMANVAMFDQHKLNYFTREAFDFFYPGYGSSYPSIMGAIGMLTEQGGIGAGLRIETNDGYHLTLGQRVFDHFQTSMATIRKAAERKTQFIEYSYNAQNPSLSKGKSKAYIIQDDGGPYINELLRILLHHGVQVKRAEESFSVSAVDYATNELSKRDFPTGSYIVDANQQRHLFIHSILQRNMIIEDSVMYDMATWSAPLAYNIPVFSTSSNLSIKSSKVKSQPVYKSGILGEEAKYAYTIDWEQRFAPKALAAMWEKGYRVRVATKSFKDENRVYNAGTLIVLLGRNLHKANQIHNDLNAIARNCKIEIQAHDSGRMPNGIDLASNSAVPLKKPRIALLVESPFSTYTCGQIYFMFDQETSYPVDRIRTSAFAQTAAPKFGFRYGGIDLFDYDVLIMAGGGNGLRQLFDEKAQAEIKTWISKGGTLIATESAARFFSKGISKITDVAFSNPLTDSSEKVKYLRTEDREDYYGKKRIPGSALLAHTDNSNPLAYGLPDRFYSIKFDHHSILPTENFETVAYYHENPEELLIAGYANTENLAHLAGNTFSGIKKVGSGKIVYLLDNTQYRMFWRGPSRMMQNAAMIVPSVR